jgi:hypothetical protein
MSYDQTENREYNKAGGNEPMNPENNQSPEPTAVKRDQDTGITQERQAGTDSVEAKEKFRKKRNDGNIAIIFVCLIVIQNIIFL